VLSLDHLDTVDRPQRRNVLGAARVIGDDDADASMLATRAATSRASR
jgi:hypothetical protein